MRDTIIQNILEKKIIAITRVADGNQAKEITRALYEGGINLVALEFDLSNPDSFVTTAKALRAISKEFKNNVYVGAANVISKELAYDAMKDFALFIISPDADVEVIKKTRQMGLVSIPGACTPTEVKQAYAAGADMVGLFPYVEDATYMNAIRSSFGHIRFLATGDINADNVADYLKDGNVGVCVGTGLVKKEWVDAGEYWRITEAAKNLIASIG